MVCLDRQTQFVQFWDESEVKKSVFIEITEATESW